MSAVARDYSVYRTAEQQQILFGVDALTGLADLVGELAVRRPLVVTSPSVATRTSVLDRVRKALPSSAEPAVFTDSREHTPIAAVVDAYELAREHGADGIIGVGGGSAMDTAKGVAIALATGSPDISPYVGSLQRHGRNLRYTDSVDASVPVLQIPTTLSAAEATQQAGITLASGIKEQFYHPAVQASGIILDPVLTVETPVHLWLSTGIKALDHAVEVAYSRFSNDVAQALALQTIRLVATCLPRSRDEPQDLLQRARLQVGAWMVLHGSLATSCGVGLDHALVHRLGGYYGIPHGIATCVTLPYAMEANRPAATTALADIAHWGFGVEFGASNDIAAQAAISRVRGLIASLGMPDRLRQWVPDPATMDHLVPLVLADTAMAGNPRRDLTSGDVVQLLHRAW